jgi:hypothetical protein
MMIRSTYRQTSSTFASRARGALGMAVLASCGLLAPHLHAAGSSSRAIGLGARTGLATVSLGAPDSREFTLPRSGARVEYSSFSGYTSTSGFFLEGRIADVIGLELGGMLGTEQITSRFLRNARPVDVVVSQYALRLEMLVKGILPLSSASPFVELGPEYVHTWVGRVAVEPDNALHILAAPEPSFWVTAGIGIEVLAHEPLRLWVPVSIRASLNPEVGETLGERVSVSSDDVVRLDSSLRYLFGLFVGVRLDFYRHDAGK